MDLNLLVLISMTQLRRLIYHREKAKENRERKEFIKQQNKFNEINDRIDPFKVVIKGDHARYLTKLNLKILH